MGEFPNTETQFKKGEGGRPKGARNRSTIYRELMDGMALKTTNPRLDAAIQGCFVQPPKTIADQVAVAMVLTALQGDVAAAREVMDSAYGKLTDKVNTTHSFRKMGKVVAVPVGAQVDPNASSEEQSGQNGAFALTFDVGEDAHAPENSIEEQGEDEHEDDPTGRDDNDS